MLRHMPIDVATIQEVLRDMAEGKSESIQDPTLRLELLQVAAELPLWQLTKVQLITQPERAQWLFHRLQILFSGVSTFLRLTPKLEEANTEAEYSAWLSAIGQKIAGTYAPWIPVEQEKPAPGVYVLARCPSGYVTTPEVLRLARYDKEYRPRDPWVSPSNDCISDEGHEPTHWRVVGALLDPPMSTG